MVFRASVSDNIADRSFKEVTKELNGYEDGSAGGEALVVTCPIFRTVILQVSQQYVACAHLASRRRWPGLTAF
jgi:hypothetical protein